MKEHTAHLAKKYGIYCIAGTVIEKITEESATHFHNVSYVFDPNGKILGRYAKRHLTPEIEKKRMPGESHLIIDTELVDKMRHGWKIRGH